MVGIGSISDRADKGRLKVTEYISKSVIWFGVLRYEKAGDETVSTCVYESFYSCIYPTFFYSILTP
jgi:hypothetical protein